MNEQVKCTDNGMQTQVQLETQENLQMKEACRRCFEPARAATERLLRESGKPQILLAIDGKCAGGKTTLGYYLQSEFGGTLLHMDDFFLRPEQRTKERLSQPGGNVDYERFREEVLRPLIRGEDVCYRPFNCSTLQVEKGRRLVTLDPGSRLYIIEGSYSCHPYFENPYDLRIFIDINEKEQLERIRRRNGEQLFKRFQNEWIPMENTYFEYFQIQENSDIRLSI